MRRAPLIAGIVLALAATGCGGEKGAATAPSPTPALTGVVVDMEYDAATTKRTCRGTGHNRRCRTIQGKPECWEIEVRRADGTEGETCVGRERYARYVVGDQYP